MRVNVQRGACEGGIEQQGTGRGGGHGARGDELEHGLKIEGGQRADDRLEVRLANGEAVRVRSLVLGFEVHVRRGDEQVAGGVELELEQDEALGAPERLNFAHIGDERDSARDGHRGSRRHACRCHGFTGSAGCDIGEPLQNFLGHGNVEGLAAHELCRVRVKGDLALGFDVDGPVASGRMEAVG